MRWDVGRPRWFQVLVWLAVVSVGCLLALVLASLTINARQSARADQELLKQGEQDRACLVSLALELGDPERDRDKKLVLPDACLLSPAAQEAVEGER